MPTIKSSIEDNEIRTNLRQYVKGLTDNRLDYIIRLCSNELLYRLIECKYKDQQK